MDNKDEYHDPDYPEASVCVKEEVTERSEEEKIEKIKQIIRREFGSELCEREDEVKLINQRVSTARRLMHQLRYVLVNVYYNDQKLQLSGGQLREAVTTSGAQKVEMKSSTGEPQKRIHPSVKKLLGSKSVDLDEILRTRGPRSNVRKDYSAMVQKRNYTIAADATKSLRPVKEGESEREDPQPTRPKKTPRHLEPKVENVLTLDEVTRNKMKHRYRLIIGNTSKYAPGASASDRSTHKWLLYVRPTRGHVDVGRLVRAVTVRLHHSYAPHHTVHIDKPPFQVSRRGWGEFPAKVELHFALPDRNRPVTIEHTIKLDRNYTGLQTLGAETIVDVWLYSTPEMLEYEYKDDSDDQPKSDVPPVEIKTEKMDITNENPTDSWLDFFTKETELNVDDMIVKQVKTEALNEPVIKKEMPDMMDEVINNFKPTEEIPNEILNQSAMKRIMKYIDPTTGKIYYLEMDRALDLSKVQEIVISNDGEVKTAKISPIKSNGLKSVRKRKGISLLKPEVKNQLDRKVISHIVNDHCYLGANWCTIDNIESDYCELMDSFRQVIPGLCSVRAVVNYMLKKIPLISQQVQDPAFEMNFPFVVDNEEYYWKLDFAKRRNMEWSRAKLINKMLKLHFKRDEKIWRTKQILIYSRLHGFYPTRPDTYDIDEEKSTREYISADINSLSLFNPEEFSLETPETIDLLDAEKVIDVEKTKSPVRLKVEVTDGSEGLEVMPVQSEEERERFIFIERKCADIGIELRNEDVGSGYSYSAVHAALLSATRSFAAELIRSGLAAKLAATCPSDAPGVWLGSSSRPWVQVEELHRGACRSPRLHAATGRGRGRARGALPDTLQPL